MCEQKRTLGGLDDGWALFFLGRAFGEDDGDDLLLLGQANLVCMSRYPGALARVIRPALPPCNRVQRFSEGTIPKWQPLLCHSTAAL